MHFDNMAALIIVVIWAITCTASSTKHRRYQDDFSDPRQRLSSRIDSLTPQELLDLYDDLERYDDTGSDRRREVNTSNGDKTSKPYQQSNSNSTSKVSGVISANENKNKSPNSSYSSSSTNQNSKVSNTGVNYASYKASNHARVSGKANQTVKTDHNHNLGAKVATAHSHRHAKPVTQGVSSGNQNSAKSRSSLIESALETAMESLSEGSKKNHTVKVKPFLGEALILKIHKPDSRVPLWKLKRRRLALSYKISHFCSMKLDKCRMVPVRDLQTLRGLVDTSTSDDDKFTALLNVAEDSVIEEKEEKSGNSRARHEFQYGLVQKIDQNDGNTNTPKQSRSIYDALRYLCSPGLVLCEVIAESKPNKSSSGEATSSKTHAQADNASSLPTTSRPVTNRPSTKHDQPPQLTTRPSNTGQQTSRPVTIRPSTEHYQPPQLTTRPSNTGQQTSRPSKPRPSNTGQQTSRPSKPRPSNTGQQTSRPSRPRPSNTGQRPSRPSKPRPSNTGQRPSRPSKTRPSNIGQQTSRPSKPRPSNTGQRPSRPSKTRPSNTSYQPSLPNITRPINTGYKPLRPPKIRPSNADNQLFGVIRRANTVAKESPIQLLRRKVLLKKQLQSMCGVGLTMCNMVLVPMKNFPQYPSQGSYRRPQVRLPLKQTYRTSPRTSQPSSKNFQNSTWTSQRNAITRELALIKALEGLFRGNRSSTVGSTTPGPANAAIVEFPSQQLQKDPVTGRVVVPANNPEYADKSVWIGICVGVGMSLLMTLLLFGCYRCLLHYRSERQNKQLEKLVNRSRHDKTMSPMHITMAKKGNNRNGNHYVVSILNDREREEDDWSSEEEVFNVSNPMDYPPKPNRTPTPLGTPVKNWKDSPKRQR